MDTLYWYYVQSKKCGDVIGNIISQIKESGHKMKSRINIIQQLLQQDIVSRDEFDDLMKFEDSQLEREAKFSGSGGFPSKDESGIDVSDHSDTSAANNHSDDIKVRFPKVNEKLFTHKFIFRFYAIVC